MVRVLVGMECSKPREAARERPENVWRIGQLSYSFNRIDIFLSYYGYTVKARRAMVYKCSNKSRV